MQCVSRRKGPGVPKCREVDAEKIKFVPILVGRNAGHLLIAEEVWGANVERGMVQVVFTAPVFLDFNLDRDGRQLGPGWQA